MEIVICDWDTVDRLQYARVKHRAIDDNRKPIGTLHNNPIVDWVKYLDGRKDVLIANIIAENLLAQVDQEGHHQLMLDEITDYRKLLETISKEEGTYQMSTGCVRNKRTTQGWEFYVIWKDSHGD